METTTVRSAKLVTNSVCLLALTCLALSGFTLANRRAAGRFAELAVGDPVHRIEGLTLDGSALAVPTDSCKLVRYSSRSCRFSRADEAEFSRLEKMARQIGCDTAVIAPSESEFSCDASAGLCIHSHVARLTLGSVNELRLEATPTTLVLKGGRVMWLRRGSMSDADRKSAEASLAQVGALALAAAGH